MLSDKEKELAANILIILNYIAISKVFILINRKVCFTNDLNIAHTKSIFAYKPNHVVLIFI